MMADRRRPRFVFLALLAVLGGWPMQSPGAESADGEADAVPTEVRIERLREAIDRERDALERERATRRSMAEELERMREELERTREKLDRLERETVPGAGAGE